MAVYTTQGNFSNSSQGSPYFNNPYLQPDEIIAAGGDPSVPSLAYTAALPDWALIRDILSGARTVRGAREKYLPKYADESTEDYDRRVQNAPFVNLFADNVRAVAAKPFSKNVALQGDIVDEDLRAFAEDIDGHGTSLHKFARDVYEECVAFGMVGLMVDMSTMDGPTMTLEQKRAKNPRPYWAWYRPEDVLCVYTEFRAGRRYVTHVRLREDEVRRYGFTERPVRKVRILNDDGEGNITWMLLESGGAGWRTIGQGKLDLDEIPFRILKFGKRDWWTNATVPPLVDMAYLQIEHYQQSSGLKHVLELTGFPMLAGQGIDPPNDPVTGEVQKIITGPSLVLFAPPQPGLTVPAKWEFVEPAATSIKALQEQVDRIEDQMAKIGMAPLIRQSGALTATAEAVNSSKAHAAAEAWALDLKDMLEQLFVFTAKWVGKNPDKAPEVYIHTDFGIELKENAENSELLTAHQAGSLSVETLWDEWQRRGFTGPQFDPEVEKKRIAQNKADGIIIPMVPPGAGKVMNVKGVDANLSGPGKRAAAGKPHARHAKGNTWESDVGTGPANAGDNELQREGAALASG